MAELMLEEQRENWGSRAGFVLAAIGSAVGLGNLWGFPYKLYSYGGGAFLIPYVIAMLLIGIPLLIAEFSLGHLTQRATPDAFGRANRRFAFVGWWQIILSFVIITYYAVILAYCLSFLVYSVQGIFQGSLPWAGKGIEGVKKANNFFFKEYLSKGDGFGLGRLQVHIIGALVVTWVAMYLCIFRGVKLVSKVVMWTVPLPWLMLLILTIRGLTLDGAVQGLEYYLEPNWTKLANPTTWRWAFGQMFFSMSLAFGVMITYASFLHRKSDLNNNATIIGLADMGTSFVAGLAVFATLGGMTYATAMAGQGVPVEKVAEGGPSLAFVAFPYALAQLPYAAWFSALFFTSLLLLGIDSAFSITESTLASIVDKTGWNRGKVLIAMSLVGLVIGLLFCTQCGLNWLEIFDDFINGTWGITLTALLECFILGWLFRLRRLRNHANERSDWRLGAWWDWCIRLVIPIVLAALFAWSLLDSLSDPKGYARRYTAGEVSVSVPAAETLPPRPVLQLRFVADFSGDAEHEFELDETKPDSAKAWTLGSGEPVAATQPAAATQATTQSQPASQPGKPAPFKAADLIGKELRFTSGKITPRTAYAVQYRWNSRPKTDPKTGLPIKPEAEPKWTSLTRLTTASTRSGVHLGNCVGLGLMGLAPVLAIVIAALRFRRKDDEAIHTPYTDAAPKARGLGAVAVLIGLAAVAVCAAAAGEILQIRYDLRRYGSFEEVAGHVSSVRNFLILGGVAALAALVLTGPMVLRLERKQIKASMVARLGAGIGVLGLGVCGGLGLALAVIAAKFPAVETKYDAELSGTSYVVLGVMLALIVVGLLWCFYRAIKAAGGASPPEQPAEGAEP